MKVNYKGEHLVQHHIKYKEIHGVDEVVMMTMSDHVKLHNKLRRENKCNVPVKELHKISRAARSRSDYGGELSVECSMEYNKKNIKKITFYDRMDPGIYLAECISFNSKTEVVCIFNYFRYSKGRVIFIDI